MQSHIQYQHSIDGITADQLKGIRSEWKPSPNSETNLRSMQRMSAVTLAVNEAVQVVGYVCGLTDHTTVRVKVVVA